MSCSTNIHPLKSFILPFNRSLIASNLNTNQSVSSLQNTGILLIVEHDVYCEYSTTKHVLPDPNATKTIVRNESFSVEDL